MLRFQNIFRSRENESCFFFQIPSVSCVYFKTILHCHYSRHSTANFIKMATKVKIIDHFTVVCSVAWPFDGSEAGVDLVLIQTSLLLFQKKSCSDAN